MPHGWGSIPIVLPPGAVLPGGHIAAAAGLITSLDEPAENLNVSSRPDALVLFNPVVVLAPIANDSELTLQSGAIATRIAAEQTNPTTISPWHHVAKGAPPTIIFHGRADTTVPYLTVESFTQKMVAAGNRCELVGFEGQNHGFFNHRPGGNRFYDETMHQAESFLASLGYLK